MIMIPRVIKEQIETVNELRVVNTDKTMYRFDSATNTLYIPISETDFSEIFSHCSFKKLELCIDNKIEKVIGMFYKCTDLNKITFTKKLNLYNVTSLDYMFCKCTSLVYFDFKDIIISKKLKNVSDLFSNCECLREVNFRNNFHTEDIENINYIFYNCKNLKEIIWEEYYPFNNLKFMTCSFMNCKSLKRIDLRRIDFNRVTNLKGAFSNTESKLEVLVNNTFREEMLY